MKKLFVFGYALLALLLPTYALAALYGSNPTVTPSVGVTGKVITGFEHFFASNDPGETSFLGNMSVLHAYTSSDGIGSSAGKSEFSWFLEGEGVAQEDLAPWRVVFRRPGIYKELATRFSSYTYCSGGACTSETSQSPQSSSTIEVSGEIIKFFLRTRASGGNGVRGLQIDGYEKDATLEFSEPLRESTGVGDDPLYLELPAGDAYVVQVAEGGPLIDAFVLPELPLEGMSLHLFDGSEDIKLLEGMVYDLPGEGVSSFALVGDPPSLLLGLLFNTNDSANIGNIFVDTYRLTTTASVPEPSSVSLLTLALLTAFTARRRVG